MPLCVFRVPISPPSEGAQKTAGNVSPSEGGRGRWRTGNALQPLWSGFRIFPPSEGVQKWPKTPHLRKVGEGAGGPEMPYSRSGAVSTFSHLQKVCRNGRKRLTFGRWERALESLILPYSRSGAVPAFSHLQKVCGKWPEMPHLRKVDNV